jgi:hypothetical protein
MIIYREVIMDVLLVVLGFYFQHLTNLARRTGSLVIFYLILFLEIILQIKIKASRFSIS